MIHMKCKNRLIKFRFCRQERKISEISDNIFVWGGMATAVSHTRLFCNTKARVTLYRIAIGAEQSGVIFTPK